MSEAIRDWVTNVGDTHYVIGSAVGPAPYPGDRARPAARDRRRGARADARAARAGCPTRVDRLRRRRLQRDRHLRRRSSTTPASSWSASRRRARGSRRGRHGAPLTVGGRPACCTARCSALMQDEDGQILEAHSISAGLDYPGAGPEHAWLRDRGRATLRRGDRRARRSPRSATVARLEGIIPALETAHALAWVLARPERLRARPASACPAAATRTSPRCWRSQ